MAQAFAHGVTGGGDHDEGNEFFWLYGLVLAAIAGFLIYRKWWRNKESPERRALRRQLGDFERDLALYVTQLQNAEDYPRECGLTGEERRQRQDTVTAIQREIDEIKMDLATT